MFPASLCYKPDVGIHLKAALLFYHLYLFYNTLLTNQPACSCLLLGLLVQIIVISFFAPVEQAKDQMETRCRKTTEKRIKKRHIFLKIQDGCLDYCRSGIARPVERDCKMMILIACLHLTSLTCNTGAQNADKGQEVTFY